MMVLQEIRRRARHVVGPLLGAGAVVYFGYHTIEGDRGVLAWLRLRHDIRQAEESLEEVSAVRRQMEHRASLLRPDNLDPDMLEERARLMLNFGHPGDIVILDADR